MPSAGLAHPRWWAGAVALILGVLALRLVYLALFCPYILVEDEAQYWDWARHLSWSYYTKGPGIAWTIAAATTILGDTELAVRAPSALWAAVGAMAVGMLVRDQSRDGRAAFFAVSAILLTPALQVTALLGTIDGAYCACWAVAAWAGWRALAERRGAAWLLLGAALGVGFLYKYTIVLLVPGLVLFAWLRPPAPRRVVHPVWIVVGVMLALLGCAPVLIWNAQHDWATVNHLLGHLGLAEKAGFVPLLPPGVSEAAPGGRGWSPWWMLEFAGTQLALAGPLLVVGLWAGWRALRHAHERANFGGGRLYLAACAAPILGFYFLVSLVTAPEGNWPMAAFVTLVPLAGWCAADAMADYAARVRAWRALPTPQPKRGFVRRKPETAGQIAWHFAIGYGLVAGLGALRIDLLAALPVVGAWAPVGRLEGGVIMARTVQTMREQVMAESGHGGAPFVMTIHYGQAAQLAFYLPDRPAVFCASSRTGGRPTQHDFWSDTDLADPALLGRPAIIVGGSGPLWAQIFDRVEDEGLLPGVERKGLHAFRAYGFRGFPADLRARDARRPTP